MKLSIQTDLRHRGGFSLDRKHAKGMTKMTILDRLLGHDAWTTRQLLLRSLELSDEQLDREFDIGDRSLRSTFDHIIQCLEHWTDRMMGRPVRQGEWHNGIERLLERQTEAAKEFAEFAMKVEREGRADEMFTKPEDGKKLSLGGGIAHILTHSMHHRAQTLYILEQLGIKNVIEGDALGWESVARGWGWAAGGSYGDMVVG